MKIHKMSLRKRHFLLATLLVLFLASIPTGYAEAGIGIPFIDLGDIAKDIGVVIATAITGVLAIAPALIFFVVSSLLSWFIDIVFSIPIVPGSAAGAPPQFVTHGWDLLRALANMFFLLILVFIGLATILRLREYELQRTLPRLIIAALLVNFSAVFVGFVVDLSNLVADSFLSRVGGLNLNVFTALYESNDATSDLISNATGNFLTTIVAGFVYGFVLVAFYFIASLAFIAVFFIFLLRTIILWILVVLSPLAFAAAVLPTTRSLIWNRWWGSLLQWSIVVIPISFFLWLALSVMTLDSQDLFRTTTNPAIDLTDDPGGISAAIAQFLALAMGPLVGIFILLIGITVSMSMAPGSIRAIGNFTRKAAIVGTVLLGALAVNRFFSKQRRDEQETGSSLAQRMEQRNFGLDWKEHKLRSALITVATGGFAPLARAGLRKGIKEGRKFEEKNSREAIDKGANEHKGKSIEQINREMGGLVVGKDDKTMAELLLGSIRGGHNIHDMQDQDKRRHAAEVLFRDAKPENVMELAASDSSLLTEQGAASIWGRERAKGMRQRMLQAITPLTRGRLRTETDPETGRERIADRDARLMGQELQDEIAQRQASGEIQSDEDRDAFIRERAVLRKVARRLRNESYDQMDIGSLLHSPENRPFLDEIIKTNDNFIKKLLQERDVEAAQAIQDRAREMEQTSPGLLARSEKGSTTLAMPYSRFGQDHGMTHWEFEDPVTGAPRTFIDPSTGAPIKIDHPAQSDAENRRNMRRYIAATRAPRTATQIRIEWGTSTPDLVPGINAGINQLRTQFGGGTVGNERAADIEDELHRQLATQQEQALIREYAGTTGTIASAVEQRAIEVGEMLDKQRREYPRFAPAPELTRAELRQAAEIASPTGRMPREETRNTLRLIAGAEIKAEQLMRQLDSQVGARRLHQEQLEAQLPALSPGDPRIPGITSQVATVRTEIGDLLVQRRNQELRRDTLGKQRTRLQGKTHLSRA